MNILTLPLISYCGVKLEMLYFSATCSLQFRFKITDVINKFQEFGSCFLEHAVFAVCCGSVYISCSNIFPQALNATLVSTCPQNAWPR
jgi:hypothetical protein